MCFCLSASYPLSGFEVLCLGLCFGLVKALLHGDGRFFAFQLSHNIKSVTLRPNGRKLCCLMLTLKDTSFLTIDKVPLKDANEMRMYLDAVHQDRVHTGKCPSSNSHQ